MELWLVGLIAGASTLAVLLCFCVVFRSVSRAGARKAGAERAWAVEDARVRDKGGDIGVLYSGPAATMAASTKGGTSGTATKRVIPNLVINAIEESNTDASGMDGVQILRTPSDNETETDLPTIATKPNERPSATIRTPRPKAAVPKEAAAASPARTPATPPQKTAESGDDLIELSAEAVLHRDGTIGMGEPVVLWIRRDCIEVTTEQGAQLHQWVFSSIVGAQREHEFLRLKVGKRTNPQVFSFEMDDTTTIGKKFKRVLYGRLRQSADFSRVKPSGAVAPEYAEAVDGKMDQSPYQEARDGRRPDKSPGHGSQGRITYSSAPGPATTSSTTTPRYCEPQDRYPSTAADESAPQGQGASRYSEPQDRYPSTEAAQSARQGQGAPPPVQYAEPHQPISHPTSQYAVPSNVTGKPKAPRAAALDSPLARQKAQGRPPQPPPAPATPDVDQYEAAFDWNGKQEPTAIQKLGEAGIVVGPRGTLYNVDLNMMDGGVAYASRTAHDSSTDPVFTPVDGGVPYASFNATLGEFHASTMLRADELLAQYSFDGSQVALGDKLDSGESAIVHVCTFKGQKAAAKVYKANTDADVAMVKEEAALQASMAHQNVIKLFGVSMSPPMVVMELCVLGSLESHLTKLRKDGYNIEAVGFGRLARYSSHIAGGLRYLESILLIHRDLAARNVLLDSEGNCKIADFGLSKRVLSTSDYYQVKRRGRLPLRWLAPEAITKGKFSSHSDVWSFGVVMWEVYTMCEMPYFSDKLKFFDSKDVITHVSSGKTLEWPPQCPGKMFSIMKRCWAFDPKERPPFCEVHELLLQAKGDFAEEEPFEP